MRTLLTFVQWRQKNNKLVTQQKVKVLVSVSMAVFPYQTDVAGVELRTLGTLVRLGVQ